MLKINYPNGLTNMSTVIYEMLDENVIRNKRGGEGVIKRGRFENEMESRQERGQTERPK